MSQTPKQNDTTQRRLDHIRNTMSSNNEVLRGWACHGKGQELEITELPLKTWTEDDIDIKVSHCGICGSDLHTIDSGWGPTPYPCVVGHEIAGTITRVGANVKELKVGDRAGVGAQSGSCGECEECKAGDEHICARNINTYGSKWPDGSKSYGGYADRWRGNQKFVFKIPDGMSNEVAATFFCAGVTTYSPLAHHNVGPGSKVGIVGIGGLGHYGLQFAKALGAEVYAISSSDRKKDDAKALGADHYLIHTNADEMKNHRRTLTHILCTSFSSDFPWNEYLGLLRPNGKFILVGLPEKPLSGIRPNLLATRQLSIVGSTIGSPKTIREMMELASKKGIKPWIQKYPMNQVNDAIKAMRKGEAKYRFVLEN